jgi:hypothetical protein
MKKRFVAIIEKTLKSSLNCFFNFTFDGMNQWLEKNGYPKVEEKFKKQTLGLYWVTECEKTNSLIYAIWIPKFDLSLDSLCVLTHELHHVVERQAEDKGIECAETKAYLIEYYMKEILKEAKYNYKKSV